MTPPGFYLSAVIFVQPARDALSSAFPLPQEPPERPERGLALGDMVLDPLGVLLCRFHRNAQREQYIDHQPVACPHPLRQALPGLAEEHPAIRLGDCQPFPLQRWLIVLIAVACDTPSRRAISVGRASPSLASRSEISST